MNKLKHYFFEEIDNSSLVVFRILLGFLLSAEGFGAIITGWVKETFIDTKFNFTAIGLEWMQPLPGYGMYIVYSFMGVLGICIMLGFYYRITTILYFIVWTCTYLMQKTHYNNHYYLIVLLAFVMMFMPAHRYASLDAKKNPDLLSTTCPRWTTLFFILQLLIVYTFASLHKVYPDWLAGKPIGLWFTNKANYPELAWLKPFLLDEGFQKTIGYLGILYDGLVIPALLWRRTRWLAIFASFGFHLFNSLVFQIGVFPYLSLTFIVFFFPPEIITKRFFKKKLPIKEQDFVTDTSKQNLILSGFILYFVIQLFLPVRHHFIEGNVFWTEEGHKMAWRMMLRSKGGHSIFILKDRNTQKSTVIPLRDFFSRGQLRCITKNPDVTWQAAQYLRKHYEQQGIEYPEIYVRSSVSLNGCPQKQLIDNTVDLAHTSWNFFSHNKWIHSYEFE